MDRGSVTVPSTTTTNMAWQQHFCADCAEFYCEACVALHRTFPVTRDHEFRPAVDVDRGTALATKVQKRNLKCGEHPDTELDFYCDTCHVPVCTKCCLQTHKQHQHRDMTAVGKEYQTKLEKVIQAAEVHVNKVRGQLRKLKASSHSIQQDTNKARQEVKEAANEIRDLATKREQYLLQQIQDIEQEALAQVTSAQEDTELKIATTESLLSHMQALHDSGDVADQVVHTPDVEKQLHQQQAASLSTVEWTASFKKETNSVVTLNAMLGSVATNEMKLGQPLKSLKTGLDNNISGLVVVNGCVCATAWWQPVLYIHNTTTKVSKQLKVEGLSAVSLATIRATDNTLVIADGNKKLHFVTFNQHSMEIIRHTVNDITFTPRCISIHPVTGHMIIADNTNEAIVVCDTQGTVQNTITVQTKVGSMRCAVVTNAGYVILDHSNAGRVHWLDNQGRVTRTYGNREGEGLLYPEHMVRTRWGQLVVADSCNHRLHLLDASGQLTCYLLTEDDGIRYPFCVWLDEASSLLYVGHSPGSNKEVWVYKWPRQLGLLVTVGTHK